MRDCEALLYKYNKLKCCYISILHLTYVLYLQKDVGYDSLFNLNSKSWEIVYIIIQCQIMYKLISLCPSLSF